MIGSFVDGPIVGRVVGDTVDSYPFQGMVCGVEQIVRSKKQREMRACKCWIGFLGSFLQALLFENFSDGWRQRWQQMVSSHDSLSVSDCGWIGQRRSRGKRRLIALGHITYTQGEFC